MGASPDVRTERRSTSSGEATTTFFFLTYGSDVQWVKNILATGSCSIETRGRVVELLEPELVTDPELRPAPPHVRFVERRIAGVTQYLRMRASSSSDPAG